MINLNPAIAARLQDKNTRDWILAIAGVALVLATGAQLYALSTRSAAARRASWPTVNGMITRSEMETCAGCCT